MISGVESDYFPTISTLILTHKLCFLLLGPVMVLRDVYITTLRPFVTVYVSFRGTPCHSEFTEISGVFCIHEMHIWKKIRLTVHNVNLHFKSFTISPSGLHGVI
jgi:hypothetical protein